MEVNSKRFLFILPMIALMAVATQGISASQSDTFPVMSVDELILMMAKKKPVTIIDVRNTDSYEEKILGALQIPEDQVESRLKEIPRNRPIVTYCA